MNKTAVAAKAPKAKAIKMPQTLGATIDLLFTLDQQADDLKAQAREIEKQRNALEEYLRTKFDDAGIDGAHGKAAKVEIKKDVYPECSGEDWDKLFSYVSRTKSFDLLQKRLNVTACRERWDAGKEIPGVEAKEVSKLKIVPLKK